MIPWLEAEDDSFPPVHQALDHPNGLLAAGGELTPARLLQAYRQGIFPWFNPGEPILWWSPNPRCVIEPGHLHISRSLKKAIRQSTYQVTFDRAFSAVMQACAEPRQEQQGTWISPKMIQAYSALHRQGIAHSVEVWDGNLLIGGLYGLAIGRLFFGESMFSRQTNASKIAFSYLCVQLKQWEFKLIDCQVHNPHLESLGASMISRERFCELLTLHLDDPGIKDWQFTVTADKIVADRDLGVLT